jgi:hypothetical protein
MTFGKWYLKFVKNKKSHSLARATADPHVYFWIDWSCADQFDPEPYKTSLPLYLGVCHHMLSIDHARSHERAWVRAEYLMAFAFMAQGTYPFLIPLEFKGGHDELDIELRQKTLEDPRQGQTMNACDTANIAVLTDMFSFCDLGLEQSVSASNYIWRAFLMSWLVVGPREALLLTESRVDGASKKLSVSHIQNESFPRFAGIL